MILSKNCVRKTHRHLHWISTYLMVWMKKLCTPKLRLFNWIPIYHKLSVCIEHWTLCTHTHIHSISVSLTFNAIQNNNATQPKRREKRILFTLGYYLFPFQIRTLQCMWTTFFSPSWRFFFHSLIATMDFKAERHDTTTITNIQCQTSKNWRRIRVQKVKSRKKC